MDGADQNPEESNAPTAPAILWKPERIAADLKLSRQLIEKLDKEKGILSNPLIAADKLEETPAGVLLLCIHLQTVSCGLQAHVPETIACHHHPLLQQVLCCIGCSCRTVRLCSAGQAAAHSYCVQCNLGAELYLHTTHTCLHTEGSKKEEKEPVKPAVAVDADKAQPDGASEQPADAKPATEPAADGAKMDVDIDAALPSTTKNGSPTTTNYQVEVKTSEKSAAVSDSQAGDAGAHEATKEVKAEAQVAEGTEEGQEEGSVGKLDVHLTYLWRVHRVNYYVGGVSFSYCFSLCLSLHVPNVVDTSQATHIGLLSGRHLLWLYALSCLCVAL